MTCTETYQGGGEDGEEDTEAEDDAVAGGLGEDGDASEEAVWGEGGGTVSERFGKTRDGSIAENDINRVFQSRRDRSGERPRRGARDVGNSVIVTRRCSNTYDVSLMQTPSTSEKYLARPGAPSATPVKPLA